MKQFESLSTPFLKINESFYISCLCEKYTHKDNRKRIIGRSNKVLCSSDSSDIKKTSGGILWNIFAQSSEGYYENNSLIIFNITIFQSCISPL